MDNTEIVLLFNPLNEEDIVYTINVREQKEKKEEKALNGVDKINKGKGGFQCKACSVYFVQHACVQKGFLSWKKAKKKKYLTI